MKGNIHPELTPVKATCACGHVTETYSSLGKDFTMEICSACHPFFTGKQRLVDSAGRIERFQKKYAKHTAKKTAAKAEAKPTEEKAKGETSAEGGSASGGEEKPAEQ